MINLPQKQKKEDEDILDQELQRNEPVFDLELDQSSEHEDEDNFRRLCQELWGEVNENDTTKVPTVQVGDLPDISSKGNAELMDEEKSEENRR